jgi:light-regulated signal transduction histidine kinase (bacteriophytochrome)
MNDQFYVGEQQVDDLFANLVEQVKLPFLQISHAAELLGDERNKKTQEALRESIKLSSKSAIKLIDGYLLSLEIGRQQELELEPVSLSSVVYDAANSIDDFARAHGCELQLHVSGRYTPVMANRRAILAALTSLGISFVEASSTSDRKSRPIIKLAVRRNSHGISTGVFSDSIDLSSNLLKQARNLKGKVHQPISQFDSGTGAGVFIADELFSKLQANMKVAKLRGMSGLSVTLTPSKQLSLV